MNVLRKEIEEKRCFALIETSYVEVLCLSQALKDGC